MLLNKKLMMKFCHHLLIPMSFKPVWLSSVKPKRKYFEKFFYNHYLNIQLFWTPLTFTVLTINILCLFHKIKKP